MRLFKKLSLSFAVLALPFSFSNQVLAQSTSAYNYAEVLQKSMWFYEVQRSGPLDPATNRVEWRGSSGEEDGSDVGKDLTGGWLDAGDNMKFNFPMASAATLLAWGGLEYGDAYRKIGQWGYLLENLKWVTDYFIKCHTATDEFYGQVGVGMTDHVWWGAPEVFSKERPAFKISASKPGSDLASEAAATLAASSMLFRATDAAYADLCLKHAKELYAFADKNRGLYHEAIPDATDFYKSWSGYEDELIWGALWLYIATGDETYLTKAEGCYDKLSKEPQSETPKYKEALSWDDKTYGCYVLLAKITNKPRYHEDAQRWLDWWSHGYKVRQSGGSTWSENEGIAYTPKGLAWIREWGPIRYASNTGFAAMVYSDCSDVPAEKKDLYYKWAKSQVDFALGDNEKERSYVCGFGKNPPTKPHHRSMHGPWLDDNGRTPVNSRHVLFGALVGGPGKDGSYADDRGEYVKNEVATDYNAGFSSLLARLVKDTDGKPLADFPTPQVRDTEFVVDAKINQAGDRYTEIAAILRNRTTWPARYSPNLKLRYYVNLSEVIEGGLSVSDVTAEFKSCGLCDNPATVTPLIQSETDPDVYYTEVSLNDEKMYPGGQSVHRREIQFRIGLNDKAPQKLWDPTNDFSYSGLTNMIDSANGKQMPLYENGVLVWGEEPDGEKFKPATWDMPAFTEPKYAPSTWDESLFAGKGATNVKQSFNIAGNKKFYTLAQHGNILRVSPLENVRVSLFSLDGSRIESFNVIKNTHRVINLAKRGSSAVILEIASGKKSDFQVVYLAK
ncbi:MAG: endoglucanase [Fibrobacter sp.]|nr:endoglucanase [Fibrobacter sp.]